MYVFKMSKNQRITFDRLKYVIIKFYLSNYVNVATHYYYIMRTARGHLEAIGQNFRMQLTPKRRHVRDDLAH